MNVIHLLPGLCVVVADLNFLAAIGVYGMVSYAANGRRQEIAIRIAMGADARRVLGLIMYQGLAPVVAGLGVGLLGAWAQTGDSAVGARTRAHALRARLAGGQATQCQCPGRGPTREVHR